ncbi:MAG: hypothetical protein HY303_12970 [Candidatus Wallbacteria bacterium]|nr:hypothetical protein [Candidatus Wallbacteria bacterium]
MGTMIQHGLVIQRGLAAVLFVSLAAASFAQESARSIASMIPASSTGAAFVSVENIMSSFGSHFTTGSLARELDRLISQGMPDPRKQVQEVGIAFDFEKDDDRAFGLVARGQVDVCKAVEFLKAQGAELSQEAYRGVILNHAKLPKKKETLEIASLDEAHSLLSYDMADQHKLAKAIVDTVSGSAQSFGERNHTVLPKNYFACLSVDIPAHVRQSALANQMTAPLAAIKHVTGTLREEQDKSVKLQLDAACDDEAGAQGVKTHLENIVQMLLARAGNDPQHGAILRSIVIAREGCCVSLTMQLPRDLIEQILVGMNH